MLVWTFKGWGKTSCLSISFSLGTAAAEEIYLRTMGGPDSWISLVRTSRHWSINHAFPKILLTSIDASMPTTSNVWYVSSIYMRTATTFVIESTKTFWYISASEGSKRSFTLGWIFHQYEYKEGGWQDTAWQPKTSLISILKSLKNRGWRLRVVACQ